MSVTTPPFCEDCRWYRPALAHDSASMQAYYARCGRTPSDDANLLTARVLSSDSAMFAYCSTARGRTGDCGVKAKLFECAALAAPAEPGKAGGA